MHNACIHFCMEYIYKQNNFSVMVSFDSTAYTVTEGVDPTVELMLIRGGDLNRVVVVTVTTVPATANGMIDIIYKARITMWTMNFEQEL